MRNMTYFCFHSGSLLNVYDNITVSSSYHCNCSQQKQTTIRSLYCMLLIGYNGPSLCLYTSCRHANIRVDAIRIAAELLKAVNGALTYHRFPTEWSVVNYLQHNGRCVHLLFGEKLDEEGIDCI